MTRRTSRSSRGRPSWVWCSGVLGSGLGSTAPGPWASRWGRELWGPRVLGETTARAPLEFRVHRPRLPLAAPLGRGWTRAALAPQPGSSRVGFLIPPPPPAPWSPWRALLDPTRPDLLPSAAHLGRPSLVLLVFLGAAMWSRTLGSCASRRGRELGRPRALGATTARASLEFLHRSRLPLAAHRESLHHLEVLHRPRLPLAAHRDRLSRMGSGTLGSPVGSSALGSLASGWG